MAFDADRPCTRRAYSNRNRFVFPENGNSTSCLTTVAMKLTFSLFFFPFFLVRLSVWPVALPRRLALAASPVPLPRRASQKGKLQNVPFPELGTAARLGICTRVCAPPFSFVILRRLAQNRHSKQVSHRQCIDLFGWWDVGTGRRCRSVYDYMRSPVRSDCLSQKRAVSDPALPLRRYLFKVHRQRLSIRHSDNDKMHILSFAINGKV